MRCSVSQSSSLCDVLQPFSKTVEENGDLKTYVSYAPVNCRVLAARSDIPTSENYMLREMLKQGFVPAAVHVGNLFDSNDPLDSVNQNLINQFESVNIVPGTSENVESSND